MALLLDNCLEGGSDGTTVSTGNSGGSSFNAFGGVTIGANMTCTFSNTHFSHGSLGLKFALTSTATAITYVEYTPTEIGTAVATIYGRVYYWCSIIPASSTRMIAFYNGTTLAGSIIVASGTNTISWKNSADGTFGTPSTAMSTSTLYRLEFAITGGASGSGTVKVYAGDSLTSLATDCTFTATSFGTTFNRVRFGCTTANFSSTSGAAFWLDDINLNDTGYPGIGPASPGGDVLRPNQNLYVPRFTPIRAATR